MIAKYHDKYFCVSALHKKPIKIWRYDFVDGFISQYHEDGFMVYKKFVEIFEIDEFFEVGFRVKWHGEWFWCDPNADRETVILRTIKREEADKYGFTPWESDRGEPIIWCRVIPVEDCAEFELHKTVFELLYFTQGKNEAKSETFTVLGKNDWLEIYTKTKLELSPWHYASKG